jgi:threonyl-tRNA synthetase
MHGVAPAGELELWNKAEAALEEALNSTGREWVMNPGDGAFYGPKIDITGELPHCCRLAVAAEYLADAAE